MFDTWIRKIFAGVLSLGLTSGVAVAAAGLPDGYRLSEPVTHGNLAIYFVRGPSRGGPVPLTLQEALARGAVEVREIGHVNELEVENTGAAPVFLQAGDIVKGGQQDRVIGVSVMLPPRSGAIPIASFCVEHGRWAARGTEDARKFSSSDLAMPSRRAKLEMAGAAAPSPEITTAPVGPRPSRLGDRAAAPVASRQQQIWDSVAQIQGRLSQNLGAPVAAPRSETSLQLSLENERLARAQAEAIAVLAPRGEADDDIVGYAFAINGRMNSADIYPSNGLFRKMWPKLLQAAVTEAIADRGAADAPAPPAATVQAFIAEAESATGVENRDGDQRRVRIKESAKALSLETRAAAAPASDWVHRSYIAK